MKPGENVTIFVNFFKGRHFSAFKYNEQYVFLPHAGL